MKKIIVITSALLVLLCGCGRTQHPTATPVPSLQSQPPPSAQTVVPSATALPPSASPSATLSLPTVTPQNPETPAPTLKAATGEIPASQSFTSYSSADGHYDIQYPEGWTPAVLDGDAKFIHNYDGLQVAIVQSSDPFTPDAIMSKQVANLIRTGKAVAVKNVSKVTAKSGNAVLVEFDSNSDPINGKKVRLSNQRYYFFSNGRLAALTMWAPLGSENKNIWKQIPDTFTWR